MLSQPRSRIQLSRVMNQGQILLVDLSRIGGETAEVLGNLMLAMLLHATLDRSKTQEEERRPFSIFLDEAHRFVQADAIENIITQSRKYGNNLCLAHQYLSQFPGAKTDALSSTGCTILGRLDKRDSQYFTKDLQDKVEPKDIMSLEPFEMIGRIGTDIVRFHTLPPPQPAPGSDVERLIQQSRQAYCAPARDIRAWLAQRPAAKRSPRAAPARWTKEDFAFDEF